MSEQSEPKNHHFIPQFYQRGFTEGAEGLIWIYEKDKNPRKWTIRKTGAEIGFYGFTTSSGEFDIATVERDLGKLEVKTAPLIKKLEEGNLLTDDERHLLSKFISVMWRRTPKEKEKVEKAAEEMIPKTFEKIQAEIYQLVKEMTKSPEEAEILFEDKKKVLERVRRALNREEQTFFFHSMC
jgi:carbon monoxide dehydrogenase subunit G